MNIPQELYTVDSLLTLAGSSAAVFIITSVVGYLIGPKNSPLVKKWLGLVLALGLALLGITQVTNPTVGTWAVAVVNGFLIYLTAIGANIITATATTTKPRDRSLDSTPQPASPGSFGESWF